MIKITEEMVANIVSKYDYDATSAVIFMTIIPPLDQMMRSTCWQPKAFVEVISSSTSPNGVMAVYDYTFSPAYSHASITICDSRILLRMSISGQWVFHDMAVSLDTSMHDLVDFVNEAHSRIPNYQHKPLSKS